MAFKSLCTDLTAQNATETTKTLIGTLTVPQGVSRIVGVAAQCKAAGLTTLESLSGILELESDDMTAGWSGTQTFLLPMQNALTSGATGLNPYVYATDIKVSAGGHVKCSTTMDQALTINPSWRVMLQFE